MYHFFTGNIYISKCFTAILIDGSLFFEHGALNVAGGHIFY